MRSLLFIFVVFLVVIGGGTAVANLYEPQDRPFVGGMWLVASVLGIAIFYYFFPNAFPGRSTRRLDEGGD